MRLVKDGAATRIRLPRGEGRPRLLVELQVCDHDQQPRSSWPYGAALPHRYRSRYGRYQALGSLVDVAEDARAYAGSEPPRDVERSLARRLAFDQIHKEGVAGK